jgi:1,4-alpha-glucan branching enzyme
VEFTFAGNAQSVALAGDFNQWSPTTDPMKRGPDGAWTIVKKLAPGTYAYKYVVNGTTWKQDEANPNGTDDGFGGKNSVVTVP